MSESTRAADAAEETQAVSEQPQTDAEQAPDSIVTTESTAGGTETEAAPFDPQRRATELAVLDSLRAVVDPELGMDVIELALIRQIIIGKESSEVKMVLTTPFCPYAGSMIQQVKDQTELVLEHPVKVTVLAERWDPRDAGLMW